MVSYPEHCDRTPACEAAPRITMVEDESDLDDSRTLP